MTGHKVERFEVFERTSGLYTAVLKDEDGNNIGSGSLSTLTLTLFDTETGTKLNGRDAQDVLNDNDVTIDGSGNLSWEIQGADHAIVAAGRDREIHRAVFHAVATGGTEIYHPVDFIVLNLAEVP